MTETLLALAGSAGIAARWRDVRGEEHDVSPDTMRHLLGALDLPAETPGQVADSRARLEERRLRLPPLCTAVAGQRVLLGLPDAPAYRLTLEDGTVREGRAFQANGLLTFDAVDQPGYHRLEIGGERTVLAVCPPRCHGVAEGTRPWGLAAQLYGLRRRGDGGIGDFGALAELARATTARGHPRSRSPPFTPSSPRIPNASRPMRRHRACS
ncbi:hypothetical protein ACE7GA_10655 [Roseomonas sp. CCTCC AB2023176]|uniref:hypothetical protein n=1 Tax=Roseomonas sp. CCTCC AB2023176 TaxID=3342640 RepID=UPI0035E2E539